MVPSLWEGLVLVGWKTWLAARTWEGQDGRAWNDVAQTGGFLPGSLAWRGVVCLPVTLPHPRPTYPT